MSNKDTHFFNMFSLVLGILIAIAIALFVFARHVGATTQAVNIRSEGLPVTAVDERVEPFSKEAVAGRDNSALAIAPAAGAAPVVAAGAPKNGQELYESTCVACHGQGIGGAPKFGDKSAWGPRIAKGKNTLYTHAMGGFQGTSGMMPPKGGRTDLPDALIRQGVDYMVSHGQ